MCIRNIFLILCCYSFYQSFFLQADDAIHIQAPDGKTIIINNIDTQEHLVLNAARNDSIYINKISSSKQVSITSKGNSIINVGTLHVPTLIIRGSGNAIIFINNGKVEHQALTFSGNCSYDSKNLESTTTNIHASGNSKLLLKTTIFDGHASGNSTIRYEGDPQNGIQLSGNASCSKYHCWKSTMLKILFFILKELTI